MIWSSVLLCCLGLVDGAATPVGVAVVDITPDYPVRLNGFGFRRDESSGVRQRIWAKALAIGSDEQGPAVLLTVDTLGIPNSLVEEVAKSLREKAGVARERLAITATHTHTAPMIVDCAPTLFGVPIPDEHQARIERYSRELRDKLEQVALAAVRDRQPGQLRWGIGKVSFAANRRTAGGPVDHDLPLLEVRDPAGSLRAVHVNYACHCVSLSDNHISGDWAGYAQEIIQRQFPGCVALVAIGCGADANPSTGVVGDRAAVAEQHGAEIASEVRRLLETELVPVPGPVVAAMERIPLPLAELPSREEWQRRAQEQSPSGHHARTQLARLERGEPLLREIDYPIQTWSFGETLAMVFLPGEVVVDYSKRLKQELDGRRLWINGYTNGCPGYVPSERILREGGYEGGGAMVYYDIPAAYATGLEQKIVDAVRRQLLGRFAPPVDPRRTQGSLPRSPAQSLAALRVRSGLHVSLVAAEPLVTSPVAIDFGADGRLWVAEMFDYPSGVTGDFAPGGRVKVLRDDDGDGRFDRATVFLDGIPFPTGVTTWRDGVLVCAAPDILLARDTDGDDKADSVQKLFTGFETHNYQARVNSLEYGLDGWVYGSCGLFGGQIASFAGGDPLPLGGRDFRIQPDVGRIEPAAGNTQQGRVRNDWDDWFGCNNSVLVLHYPLPDHVLRRNPFVIPPSPAVSVARGSETQRLFGLSEPVLFKLSGPANQVTSACGLGIYRDELLGEEFRGNTFTCEPVNNVVHRRVLSRDGLTFGGDRAADETTSEFLASLDPWFRPVQARTGPDGALWIVDMYRYVIEHPRWIPPETLEQLDVRAGADRGRIYRVYPRGQEPRAVPRLDRLDAAGLVAALDSPNGWQRDMAQQQLIWQRRKDAVQPLTRLVQQAARPEVRLQALCTLDRVDTVPPQLLVAALRDEHAGVRRHALRLAEPRLANEVEVAAAAAALRDDADPAVQLQLVSTLGGWDSPQAALLLAELALRHAADPYLSAAVQSSLNPRNVEAVVLQVLGRENAADISGALLTTLVGQVAALADQAAVSRVVARLVEPAAGLTEQYRYSMCAAILESLARHGRAIDEQLDDQAVRHLEGVLAAAESTATQSAAPTELRVAAVSLLASAEGRLARPPPLLVELMAPNQPPAVQAAALGALARSDAEVVPGLLLEHWPTYAPSLRGPILDVLLSREPWTGELLAAVEAGHWDAAQLDLPRRATLLEHPNAELRAHAARLFSAAATTSRGEVVARYMTALSSPGDAARGGELFRKHCAACHRIEEVGSETGPDLRPYATKPAEALTIAVLDPNAAVDPRYVSYAAVLADGRISTGIVVDETATSLTLAAAEGKRDVILRVDLDELRNLGKSLMPEGFERELSPEAFADLVAYVQGLRPPPKALPGNRPAKVLAAADGSLLLPAAWAEIFGDAITFESTFENVGFWHGAGDHVAWTLEVPAAGSYEVWLDAACHGDAAGNSLVLTVAEQSLRHAVASTGGWDQYQQVRIGTIVLKPGAQRLAIHPEGALRGALMDLRGVRLVPEK